MNTKCAFNASSNTFKGTELEQAACLLRFIGRLGNITDTPATLPPTLTKLLTTPDKLGFTKAALRKLLTKRGILETNIGGSLDFGVSRANDNSEDETEANYFVIHDTSSKLSSSQTFDPSFINSAQWSGNNLDNQPQGKTHVYISRTGKTKTDNNYRKPFRATQFELQHFGSPGTEELIHKGRFLHHELVQPRKGEGSSDADAPDPGFTQAQYELLAICYLAASLRRRRWLTPAFHAVLDLIITGGHDDPQHFDLVKWDDALTALLAEVRSSEPRSASALKTTVLRDDPELQKVITGTLTLSASGGQVKGIGPVQDALNLLSSKHPSFAILLGGNRGTFGPRTEAAVEAFQEHFQLPVIGKVDAETLELLDRELAALLGTVVTEFKTPPASAQTTNGQGGSTTTGLFGKKMVENGVEMIEATETLTAKRDNQSLGSPRVAKQKRRKQNGVTVVVQENYAWKTRTLPNVELFDTATGLSSQMGAFAGRATFFGKSDTQDEGTGTPAFKTVQTNSSVFGISLPRQRLLDEGLATSTNGILTATTKGLTTRVEVFFPTTGRKAILPLVDVGPRPNLNAVADLTVAATAFLQGKTEAQLTSLENIQVKLRVV